MSTSTKRFAFGPGLMVTAAFIGPGTITACSLAGAKFGYALLWALLFSVFACYILQEMSARLGLVTRQGLGEALASTLKHPVLRVVTFSLVFVAILIGNSAYEGGNIGGAVVGLKSIFGSGSGTAAALGWSCGIGLLAYLLMMGNSLRLIERALLVLVALMSVAFLTTFIISKPDIMGMLRGFIPTVPDAAVLNVIALIGTTVVPYNLFLHSAAVGKRWKNPDDLPAARTDAALSIGLGGLISIAVVATAAATFFRQGLELNSVADMSQQLDPLLGKGAVYGLGIGLFAAGLSSAITAPLAAAYAICGLMGWRADNSNIRFRIIWIVVLLCGVTIAGLGIRPISVIWFAQVANGLLLPLMAIFLLYVMNSSQLLGAYVNKTRQNLLGLIVILVCLLLGGKSLMLAYQQLLGG
ncbi:Nramp family divalent metal transporter [Marinicella sp. W31]|uniref:Nramp family divalent metal transporter n=1 Tax=Marinicella sp. W31 TaxID=3023713 RepID=UPI0037583C81